MTNFIERPSGRLFAIGLAGIFSLTLSTSPTMLAAQTANTATTTGSGTYVCTPAGFGNPSRCYRR
ncbi:hypothetical protein [Octadecabacter temperatus]|uniref:hypothetical protein n=1 Tax=Octadecabacter temperatus TaxID=1458307 RepID=UPI000675E5EE|nr:hypothetical protein [Octadecabacter temperatus]